MEGRGKGLKRERARKKIVRKGGERRQCKERGERGQGGRGGEKKVTFST